MIVDTSTILLSQFLFFFFLICLIAFIFEAVTSVTIVISVIGILLRDATPILRSYNTCPYFLLVIT